MGKKSKRNKNKQSPSAIDADASSPPVAPSLRTPKEQEDETADNLRFEDPFEDHFEQEDIIANMDEEDDEDGSKPATEASNVTSDVQLASQPQEQVKVWTPGMGLQEGETLQMDESAYTMHHALTPEWPALSFDILRDSFGDCRTRFPHSMICAVGTQASRSDWNKLTIMKLTDLNRTSKKKKPKKEEDDEEMDNSDDESDDENMDESDDEFDDDPVLEHISLPHEGGVNRVRAMPKPTTPFSGRNSIVSTWSDTGAVNLYDISPALASFERSSGGGGGGAPTPMMNEAQKRPFFTYSGHSTEGFAMDWSRIAPGQLATGDCSGDIHLWTPSESTFTVQSAYKSEQSVEDIQWSPTENTVLAAAECGGCIKIYDTRKKGIAMLTTQAHNADTDVNVLAWNHVVTNLLASGSDDGVFSVWDLRNFGGGKKAPDPLARFTSHRKPITSLEWHPTDESMIVVSDDDATFIYDLSVEKDPEEGASADAASPDPEVPPQLLFMHCGSEMTKEVHWHPQIPSLITTTALSGFSVFIPSNL